jgi:hypothetical protein
VFGADIDPDVAITALDEVTFEEVDAIARGISGELSVACVGPHELGEFA